MRDGNVAILMTNTMDIGLGFAIELPETDNSGARQSYSIQDLGPHPKRERLRSPDG